jgi:hypothetical protein
VGCRRWAGHTTAPVSLFLCKWDVSQSEEARISTYVDNPLTSIRGSAREQKRIVAILVVGWLMLGFPMAFKKARCGTDVQWIGIQLRSKPGAVVAEIPAEKIAELLGIVSDFLSRNILTIKGGPLLRG